MYTAWTGGAEARLRIERKATETVRKVAQGQSRNAESAALSLSGKKTRAPNTRTGKMPNDPRLKIEDENALIKGDISGSMHSCLLAQGLSESLMGGGGLKETAEPVLVKDKD